MRIKANKTSLYKLVAEYMPLPGMKHTEFFKMPRKAFFTLDWYVEGEKHRALLSEFIGFPTLYIESKTDWHFHKPTIQELDERGMIDKGAA